MSIFNYNDLILENKEVFLLLWEERARVGGYVINDFWDQINWPSEEEILLWRASRQGHNTWDTVLNSSLTSDTRSYESLNSWIRVNNWRPNPEYAPTFWTSDAGDLKVLLDTNDIKVGDEIYPGPDYSKVDIPIVNREVTEVGYNYFVTKGGHVYKPITEEGFIRFCYKPKSSPPPTTEVPPIPPSTHKEEVDHSYLSPAEEEELKIDASHVAVEDFMAAWSSILGFRYFMLNSQKEIDTVKKIFDNIIPPEGPIRNISTPPYFQKEESEYLYVYGGYKEYSINTSDKSSSPQIASDINGLKVKIKELKSLLLIHKNISNGTTSSSSRRSGEHHAINLPTEIATIILGKRLRGNPVQSAGS